MGGIASNAVPALIEIYNQHTNPYVQNNVLDSLANIGPTASNAIPLLLMRLRDTNRVEQLFAIIRIGQIHAKPELAVPPLLELLHGGDRDLTFRAAHALGNFGSNASPAVPWLIENFNKAKEPWMKKEIGDALMKIDPEAAAKAGVK